MVAEAPRTPTQNRVIAIAGLLVTLALSIWAWQLLNRATTTGVERLARIDAVRLLCTEAWATARTDVDSMRVDRMMLPDTIDKGSEQAIDRCGDLRGQSVPNALPNPREMSGDPMPRGLR